MAKIADFRIRDRSGGDPAADRDGATFIGTPHITSRRSTSWARTVGRALPISILLGTARDLVPGGLAGHPPFSAPIPTGPWLLKLVSEPSAGDRGRPQTDIPGPSWERSSGSCWPSNPPARPDSALNLERATSTAPFEGRRSTWQSMEEKAPADQPARPAEEHRFGGVRATPRRIGLCYPRLAGAVGRCPRLILARRRIFSRRCAGTG
jgi:hypothetical protein